MGRMLEEVLTQKLDKKYRDAGFRLYEIDDHILALDKGNTPVATFSAIGITNADEKINAACEKYLKTGRAW